MLPSVDAMYVVARSLLWPPLRFGIRWTMEGAQTIPVRGPVILASNHVSYLDPLVLAYLADQRKRRVRFLAKAELFEKQPLGCGADRDHPGRPWCHGRNVDREQSSHARAPECDPLLVHLRPVGEEPDEAADVGNCPRAKIALGLAVSTVVEGHGHETLASGDSREVSVVLLPRSRSVQHDDAGPGAAVVRQPKVVREPLEDA